MFLLQQQPLETTAYMIAGFSVIFGSLSIYLLSLFLRRRNLEQDMEVLRELESSETAPRSKAGEAVNTHNI